MARMIDLRVYYISDGRINTEFDKEIIALAEKHKLREWSSGYNPDNKVRELTFEMMIIGKKRKQKEKDNEKIIKKRS